MVSVVIGVVMAPAIRMSVCASTAQTTLIVPSVESEETCPRILYQSIPASPGHLLARTIRSGLEKECR